MAHHRLFPPGVAQQQSVDRAHRPQDNAAEQLTLLRERFNELGASARRFLDGLLRDQRCGKNQARRVLGLLSSYTRKDWLAALERAVRYGTIPPRRSNASWRLRPSPRVLWKPWPTRSRAPRNRCGTNP